MRLPWETKKDLRAEVELTNTLLGEACAEQIELDQRHRAEIQIRDTRIRVLEGEGEAARLALATHHCPILAPVAASSPRIRELEQLIAALAARAPDHKLQVYATDLIAVDQGQLHEYAIQDPRSWVIEYKPLRPASVPE